MSAKLDRAAAASAASDQRKAAAARATAIAVTTAAVRICPVEIIASPLHAHLIGRPSRRPAPIAALTATSPDRWPRGLSWAERRQGAGAHNRTPLSALPPPS